MDDLLLTLLPDEVKENKAAKLVITCSLSVKKVADFVQKGQFRHSKMCIYTISC